MGLSWWWWWWCTDEVGEEEVVAHRESGAGQGRDAEVGHEHRAQRVRVPRDPARTTHFGSNEHEYVNIYNKYNIEIYKYPEH